VGRIVCQGPRLRPHALGEQRQDRRVDPISLGHLARRLGKVPHLARVRHHHRNARRRERGHYRAFEPPGRFAHQQRGLEPPQPRHELGDPRLVVRHLPSLAHRPQRHIEHRLRHVSPTNTGSPLIAPSSENGLVATRPCDMRALGPDQLFGLPTSPDGGRRPG